jgi:hypothetical protein
MEKDEIQRIRNIRKNFLEVGNPIFVGDVEILSPERIIEGPLIVVEVRHQYITPADQENENIAQAKEVKAPHRFAVQVVVVKVNPAVNSPLPIEQDMIAADVPVFFVVVVEEFYGPGPFRYRCPESPENDDKNIPRGCCRVSV